MANNDPNPNGQEWVDNTDPNWGELIAGAMTEEYGTGDSEYDEAIDQAYKDNVSFPNTIGVADSYEEVINKKEKETKNVGVQQYVDTDTGKKFNVPSDKLKAFKSKYPLAVLEKDYNKELIEIAKNWEELKSDGEFHSYEDYIKSYFGKERVIAENVIKEAKATKEYKLKQEKITIDYQNKSKYYGAEPGTVAPELYAEYMKKMGENDPSKALDKKINEEIGDIVGSGTPYSKTGSKRGYQSDKVKVIEDKYKKGEINKKVREVQLKNENAWEEGESNKYVTGSRIEIRDYIAKIEDSKEKVSFGGQNFVQDEKGEWKYKGSNIKSTSEVFDDIAGFVDYFLPGTKEHLATEKIKDPDRPRETYAYHGVVNADGQLVDWMKQDFKDYDYKDHFQSSPDSPSSFIKNLEEGSKGNQVLLLRDKNNLKVVEL